MSETVSDIYITQVCFLRQVFSLYKILRDALDPSNG